MDDYIIREKAVNAAIDAVDDWDGGCNKSRAELIEMEMNKLPAADVKPVLRGKWMLVDTEDGDRDDTLLMTWGCNRCGKEFKTAGRMDFDFCPNCGADMREDKQE